MSLDFSRQLQSVFANGKYERDLVLARCGNLVFFVLAAIGSLLVSLGHDALPVVLNAVARWVSRRGERSVTLDRHGRPYSLDPRGSLANLLAEQGIFVLCGSRGEAGNARG